MNTLNFLEKISKGLRIILINILFIVIIKTKLLIYLSYVHRAFLKPFDSEKIRKITEKIAKEDENLQKSIEEANKYQADLNLNSIKIKKDLTAAVNLNKSDSSIVHKHFKIKIDSDENGGKLNKTLNDVSNLAASNLNTSTKRQVILTE